MKASSIGKKTLRVITRQKAVVAIIVMMVMMLFFDTKFYTSYSILEMLRSAAILEIVAFGVTVAVICGGCDLSVGGTLCLGGILAIMVMNAGLPIWLAFVVALQPVQLLALSTASSWFSRNASRLSLHLAWVSS